MGISYQGWIQGVAVSNSNFTTVNFGIRTPPGVGGGLDELIVSNSQFEPAGLDGFAGIDIETPLNSTMITSNVFIPDANEYGVIVVGTQFNVSGNSFGGASSTGNVAIKALSTGGIGGPGLGTISNNSIYTMGSGILLSTGTSNIIVSDNAFYSVMTKISSSGANIKIHDNIGYNPVGSSSISVGASPFTYTSGASPETVYLSGGTVNAVSEGSTTLFTSTNVSVSLGPNESFTTTYSVVPSMNKMVH